MLETLRRIILEVNSAPDLGQALDIIVRRVKQSMGVDVVSVYLAEPATGLNVLMATDGLRRSALGQVRFRPGEGLVGLVIERVEPVNLDNAPDHPRYRFVAETGEDLFHGFLGVPIVRHRKVLGVLVARARQARKFAEDEVTFLVTLAAQLAGAISHAEASGGVRALLAATAGGAYFLRGRSGAPGVALGQALVVYPPANLKAVPDRATADAQADINEFYAAVAAVKADIRSLASRLQKDLPSGELALFDAYILMLDSASLTDTVVQRIQAGNWAQGALRETITEHLHAFDNIEDAYLRERADDVRDLGRRILMYLQSSTPATREYYPRTILVGEEVTASQLAEVPVACFAGVVSARGSGSSHVAILAKALGVPAVMGVDGLPVGRLEGQELIVDGYQGQVYVKPSNSLRAEYQRIAREEAELVAELQALVGLPAETLDNIRIPLLANTGLISDITSALRSKPDGVGLYRTEIPFLVHDHFPGEEEQLGIYRRVLEAFAPRPVTLRTLDVGGDKPLPYFPVHEDNPFLGWRGIRITLDHPEIFLTQLRAMLRANTGLNNLQIMLPMVSGVPEVDAALELIRRAAGELLKDGEIVSMPPLGIMIEIPSVVYQLGALAKRVDFFSVGTNDLTQYLLAVDRNNPQVAELYDSLHPAVLGALAHVMEAARYHHKPVSVCGEMAGDPAAVIALLGLGVDSLSTAVSSLFRTKWVIRSFSRAKAQELLAQASIMESASAVRDFFNKALEEAGLGALLRAGK